MNLGRYNCDPESIILVTAGSRGQKVLFRYPISASKTSEDGDPDTKNNKFFEDFSKGYDDVSKNDAVSSITSFSDTILANILTPQVELCGKAFLLKIDNVVFAGYPMELQEHPDLKRQSSKHQEDVMLKLFNIVFVFQVGVENSAIKCYQDLSKRIAIALKHEEHRCFYLTKQREIMLTVHDDMASLPEGDAMESPFTNMLPKSSLARHLKDAFESLCDNGVVHLMVNGWVNVSFCLPHKVHNMNQGMLRVPPKAIEASLAAMRPYHTLLFLVEEDVFLASLPGDCSPALTRLVRRSSPLKSFTTLSQDTDIPLSQIFAIAAHLVYWGKASIIFPLCESNVYAVAPSISVDLSSPLVDEFASRFPGISLHETLAEFSLPSPLAEHYNPHSLPQQQAQKVQMVVWMLQHRLLIQLQTYVFLIPSAQFDQQSDPLKGARRRPRIRWIFGGSYTEFSAFAEKEPMEKSEAAPINKIIDNVKSLSYAEKISIMQIPAASDEEDLKLFARLVNYFHGKHHIEEIMYYNNLRRSKLLTLIDKFKDVLFLCQHEDSSTATFHCTR